MLDAFTGWLGEKYTVLSSYNGRCYDSPLLKTRYRLARKDDPITPLDHVDLLFPTRRRYRGTWENCRLATIERSPTGGLKVVKRRRTDIQYFSDRQQPALRLVFEFKKIDHTKARRDAYAGAEGMERFVTGDYSVGQPVALMAGMLLKPTPDCVPALRTYLSSAAGQAALGMVANPAGQLVRSPPSFREAEFDTEHKRPAGKAPAHGSIVISHLFLSF